MSTEIEQEMEAQARSQINRKKIELAIAYDHMSKMSEFGQAERIARHYLSHSTHVAHLLQIINHVKGTRELGDDTMNLIRHLTEQIKTNHAHELGIELAWPKITP